MIRRFADFLILLATFAALASCGTTPVSTTPPPNPMEQIWASIGSEIIHLEKMHATMNEWREAACEETSINNRQELRDCLHHTELSTKEMSRVITEFQNASKVIHFGFDCDYHALVFFGKNNRSSLVIRW